jgi:hypothetical protein
MGVRTSGIDPAMNKLREITRRRKAAHARLLALDSKVYRAFLEMEKATYADGVLPKKRRGVDGPHRGRHVAFHAATSRPGP